MTIRVNSLTRGHSAVRIVTAELVLEQAVLREMWQCQRNVLQMAYRNRQMKKVRQQCLRCHDWFRRLGRHPD
jgi:hypothetical protein